MNLPRKSRQLRLSQAGGARTGSVKVRASDSRDHVRAAVIEETARERRRRRRDRRSVSPARPHLRRASRRGAAADPSPRPFVLARSGRDCHIQFSVAFLLPPIWLAIALTTGNRTIRAHLPLAAAGSDSARYRSADSAGLAHESRTAGTALHGTSTQHRSATCAWLPAEKPRFNFYPTVHRADYRTSRSRRSGSDRIWSRVASLSSARSVSEEKRKKKTSSNWANPYIEGSPGKSHDTRLQRCLLHDKRRASSRIRSVLSRKEKLLRREIFWISQMTPRVKISRIVFFG